MNHMFDTEVAEHLSVNAAILFQNIAFWCMHSEANGTNFHDGYFWTYSSNKAFREIFPYMSASQIDTALKKLLDAGLIIRGNYNKSSYDRTIWYAITESGKSTFQKSGMDIQKIENGFPKNRKWISEKSKMDFPEIENRFSKNREPIPDSNTDRNTDRNRDKVRAPRFAPPTVDEVIAYATEKGYTGFNAEGFVGYYESNGWRVGRNPMKDWRAAVRNWHSRDGQQRQNPALQYQQREEHDDSGLFVNLEDYFGGETT